MSIELDQIQFLQIKIIDALTKQPFVQQEALGVSEFETYLRQRDSHPELELWDRLGVFHPVYRIRYDKMQSTLSDQQVLQQITPGVQIDIASKANYAEWRTLAAPRREGIYFPNRSGIAYHPWQIFRVHQILRVWRRITREILVNGVRTRGKLEEMVENDAFPELLRLNRSEEFYNRVLLLLVLIDDKYLPRVTGWISGIASEDISAYYDWCDAFDPLNALKESGLTTDQVQSIRGDFASEGKRLDGYSDWYVLLRHVQPEKRKRLSGDSRLAWDYYEAAEVLSLYLHDLTGEKQPDVDDIHWSDRWKRELFDLGEESIDYEKRNALPAVLRYYGIDPRLRVLVVLEGASEIAFVDAWTTDRGLEATGSEYKYFQEYGLMTVNLGGYTGLNQPGIRNMAAMARTEGSVVYVVIDSDNDKDGHLKILNEWVRDNLIDQIFEVDDLKSEQKIPIGGMLWEPCFEDANFTLEELIGAWRSSLSRNPRYDRLNPEDLALFLEAKKSSGETPGISSLEEYANAREKRIRFKKPEIARELALTHGESNKPIIKLLQTIFGIADRAIDHIYIPRRGQ